MLSKRILTMQDLSCVGQCSLTVALPVLSAFGVETCVLPTAILSNHTMFEKWSCVDFTEEAENIMRVWKENSFKFDAFYLGYLGSAPLTEVAKKCFAQFSSEGAKVIIDPAFGDDGKLYPAFDEEYVNAMRKLIKSADIILPNLTEACHLADMPYKEKGWKRKELFEMADCLSDMGPSHVVITGIPQGEYIANYVYVKTEAGDPAAQMIRVHRAGEERCSTGDVFSAIVAADALNGVPFDKSVRKASGFVKQCIEKAMELGTPPAEGVPYELVLHRLRRG